MITAKKLMPFYKKISGNFNAAEKLKIKMSKCCAERRPFYLTKAEFEEILRWKLRQQYGRQEERRRVNSDEIIRRVTRVGLTISHHDKDYELELRVSILCSLRGVGVPVACAFLALLHPAEYAVIDFRVWRQLFGEEKRTFNISDYKRYMRQIRRLASELKWPVQQVDVAIWEYDRTLHEDSELEM